jgi:dethiobiotin synthetase
MPAAFITATGTEIGKTYVTAALARCLRARGRKVAILKPVVSGFDAHAIAASDPATLLEAIGEAPSLEAVAAIAPWRFAAPLSPDMAARLEGRAISFAELIAFCRAALAQSEDVLLIEGIGGLMVPLTDDKTILDLIECLHIAPILVAGTYVGTLSHTLAALEAMKRLALAPTAVVLNETPGSPASGEATAASLRNFCRTVPLLQLRRGASSQDVDLNKAGFGKLADLLP